MCGITGVFAFNEIGRMHMIHLANATTTLAKRGPDDFGTYVDYNVGLGHRRLSIIDTTGAGHQPMSAVQDNYTIVFNGEIYNFKSLRKDLINKGHTLDSQSDTEVLLKLYIEYGQQCVEKLDGFFAFAIRDKAADSLFVARDRFGIKPLLYFRDEDKIIFASEMKSVIAYNIKKEIDYQSLAIYLELNYLPGPHTIFKGVRKLMPGTSLIIIGNSVEEKAYYKQQIHRPYQLSSYSAAIETLKMKLETAVQDRLVSDVPLGTFLSGGIDSSVISTIAGKHIDQLHTFSIGYKDNTFFDETSYAKLVADKIGSKHTVFSLTNQELLDHVHDVLDYIDEPFADSSTIPVYILSKKTKEEVTVALSGDGADEIFSGYNKHAGWQRSMESNGANKLIQSMAPFLGLLPKSRSGKLGNTFRQLKKYADGLKLPPADRYWLWASITNKQDVLALLSANGRGQIIDDEMNSRRGFLTASIANYTDFNDFLLNDTNLVLTNDMLTKVDSMSMANSLEVRVPFLQHDLVDFAFSLPVDYKIDKSSRKKILRDAYRNELPAELYTRGKKGFEVPLLSWLRKEMLHDLDKKLFNRQTIEQQGIFNYEKIALLRKKLLSSNPGDVHAKVWALYVFQHWYAKYFDC